MTRPEIVEALGMHVRINAGTRLGDLLTDLTALSWPDAPPFGRSPFEDPLPVVEEGMIPVLTGWDALARSNNPALTTYREAARAARAALELARENA